MSCANVAVHQRWMVHAAWMEKIMSKTNYTSNLVTLEHHNRLADSELDVVTGGMLGLEIPVITGNPGLDAILKIVGQNLTCPRC
jgi:hypothetical protein